MDGHIRSQGQKVDFHRQQTIQPCLPPRSSSIDCTQSTLSVLLHSNRAAAIRIEPASRPGTRDGLGALQKDCSMKVLTSTCRRQTGTTGEVNSHDDGCCQTFKFAGQPVVDRLSPPTSPRCDGERKRAALPCSVFPDTTQLKSNLLVLSPHILNGTKASNYLYRRSGCNVTG